MDVAGTAYKWCRPRSFVDHARLHPALSLGPSNRFVEPVETRMHSALSFGPSNRFVEPVETRMHSALSFDLSNRFVEPVETPAFGGSRLRLAEPRHTADAGGLDGFDQGGFQHSRPVVLVRAGISARADVAWMVGRCRIGSGMTVTRGSGGRGWPGAGLARGSVVVNRPGCREGLIQRKDAGSDHASTKEVSAGVAGSGGPSGGGGSAGGAGVVGDGGGEPEVPPGSWRHQL